MSLLPSSDKPVGGGNELDKDDILASFADNEGEDKGVDKAPKPDKQEKENKEDKPDDKPDEEEEDDEIEIEDEDKDPDEEEKLELDKEIEIDAPPKKKELLKAYPDILKKFPFIEKMLYRDKQYNELFGSFDDAKEAAERAETFTHFETDLASGKTDNILKGVKDNDPRAFAKLVDEYLPALNRVDNAAYVHVVGNIVKHTIVKMVEEANETKNDDLKEAAQLLNQFVFGSSKFTPPKRMAEEETKDDKLEQERAQFNQERFETSATELQTKTDNTLKSTIAEYIDKKGEMTSYVKRNAINDALMDVKRAIVADSAFRKQLDRLWEQANRERYSQSSLDKIRSTYLGKAKLLLPAAIRKARTEALKDVVSHRKKKDEEDEEPTRERSSERQTRQSTPNRSGGKDEMKKGESVTDFFMRD